MNRLSSIPRLCKTYIRGGDYAAKLLVALVLVAPMAQAPAVRGGQAMFNQNPITSLRANPTISGSATSSAPLHFVVKSSAGAVVYDDPALWITHGRFAETIYPPISNGTYSLGILLGTTTIATSTLTVGLRTEPSIELDTSLASYDVADGHLMRLDITAKGASDVQLGQLSFSVLPSNAAVADVQLYGYTDSGFTTPIIASSTDPLNSVPAEISATTSVVVIDPDQPIDIPAGSTYYFDLVGTVTPSDTTYNVETTLLSDTNPHFDVLSTLASTSNVVWSPSTYGLADVSVPDWTNGALAVGIPQEGLLEVRTNPPPTDAPTCTIDASTSTASVGTPVMLTWSSTGATSAVWGDGTNDALFGSRTYTLGSTTHTYVLTVGGPYGQGACFATVVVPSPLVAPANTGVAPTGMGNSATSTATTTATVDGFTATPSTGAPSLTVTFIGSVNNAKLCSAQTFSLGFGDGATTTATVPANLCKAQSFSIKHTYTKAGTFTAGLYKGTGTSSAARIQTQVIVVKTKVAFAASSLSNFANVLSAVGSAASRVWSSLAQLFAR